MSISPLPLSYCTNVLPTRTLRELGEIISGYALPIRHLYGQPMAVGLWLSDSISAELWEQSPLPLRDELFRHQLSCYTLNAFPFGDFHTPRVKEKVYQPDWAQPIRLLYTARCARILAWLLHPGGEGSISTLPLAFKGQKWTEAAERCAIDQLIECAQQLKQLQEQSGRTIRLAIEPEPLCVLETTSETIAFFHQLRSRAVAQRAESAVNNHIGVCFDICHQAVEFEAIAQSIAALHHADIRINKVHLSSAIAVPEPAKNTAARDALKQYVEPRYLHQTFAQLADRRIARSPDLTSELIFNPPPDFAAANEWRIHFHVPINTEKIGPLDTTRSELPPALQAIAALPYSPHLEVETYTWPMLPDPSKPNWIEGIARELTAATQLIAQIHPPPNQGGP